MEISLPIICSKNRLDLGMTMINVLDFIIKAVTIARIPYKDYKPDESQWPDYMRLLDVLSTVNYMRKKCKISLSQSSG